MRASLTGAHRGTWPAGWHKVSELLPARRQSPEHGKHSVSAIYLLYVTYLLYLFTL